MTPMLASSSSKKAVFVDVDGCISLGRGHSFDIDKLDCLKQLIVSKNLYFVLHSGRSQPYLECLAQILSIQFPYICENGSAIYDPRTNTYSYTVNKIDLSELEKKLTARNGYRIVKEPGKDFSLSFTVIKNDQALPSKDGFTYAIDVLGRSDEYTITHSNSAVDIVGKNTSKGTVLEKYAQLYNINIQSSMGFGDSSNDESFLTLVGKSGAPANATSQIKSLVDEVSTLSDLDGLIAFLSNT